MPFRHDSTGIDPEAGGGFSLIPDGWYPFKIVHAEEQVSKKGKDMVFLKAAVINDPRYEGKEIWHWVVFIPKGEKGEGMSVHFRKCIGVAFGSNDLVDASDWVGKRFMGKIKAETHDGKTNNKFAEVSPMTEKSEEMAQQVNEKSDEEIPF